MSLQIKLNLAEYYPSERKPLSCGNLNCVESFEFYHWEIFLNSFLIVEEMYVQDEKGQSNLKENTASLNSPPNILAFRRKEDRLVDKCHKSLHLLQSSFTGDDHTLS